MTEELIKERLLNHFKILMASSNVKLYDDYPNLTVSDAVAHVRTFCKEVLGITDMDLPSKDVYRIFCEVISKMLPRVCPFFYADDLAGVLVSLFGYSLSSLTCSMPTTAR